MRKYIKLISGGFISVLCGCSTTFLPYEGTQIYIGKGGFLDTVYDGVAFFDEGLPQGQRCYLLGVIKDKRGDGILPQATKYSDVSSTTIDVGGNVVTKKVSMESGITKSNISYDSYSNVGSGGITSTASYYDGMYREFHVFYCEPISQYNNYY